MDETTQATLKTVLSQWVTDRQQALLEQVLLTWHEGLGRLAPDDALVAQLLAALPVPEPPPVPVDWEAGLGAGLDRLAASTTQGEVLKNLLDGIRPFADRSALFVVKQGIASLYAHRGFDGEEPRPGAPVVPPPELETLLQGQVAQLGAGPAYGALLAPLSRFEAMAVQILPLHLRRKTVAVLLADSGLVETLDHNPAVRALVHAAEAKLSYLAGVKDEERTAPVEAPPSMPTQRIPDPIMETAAPPLDPRIRSNAERSARVLVGDLELYFPEKLVKGQQQGNMYGAMRDELDRSRASFVERYGAEVEAQHRIFYQTVVQLLCEGDPSRLGPAPWAAHP